MDKPLDQETPRIRRNLTLGCAGLIAMPYALGLSILPDAWGMFGLIALVSSALLAAWGWKEIRTLWSWLACAACVIVAVCAVVAVFIQDADRLRHDLTWSYVGALGLGPALLGIFGGILFARDQLIGSPAMMLLGGALGLIGTWMTIENRDLGSLAFPLLFLGFGLTMAGPVLLTYRPTRAEGVDV